jgi:hypothetical protein
MPMPHYVFRTGENDKIVEILRDGQPHAGGVRLEQAFSIVTVYFRLAASNLSQMSPEQPGQQRRAAGLQSFLMSLTGLEAFTNTYFHLRARELASDAMTQRIERTHGSLSRRIAELVAMTPEPPLIGQDALLQRVFELSQLRNQIVHPRWEPAALTVAREGTLRIEGLVENRQAMFEDQTLCREAMLWCLLVIARIGQSRGGNDVSGHMFHWTANYGLTLHVLLSELGLSADD